MTLPAELESAARSSAAPELVARDLRAAARERCAAAERLGSDGRLAGVVAAVMAAQPIAQQPRPHRPGGSRGHRLLPARAPRGHRDRLDEPSIHRRPEAGERRRRSRAPQAARPPRHCREGSRRIPALEEVGEALSDLADGVLPAACALAGVGVGLAVIAMGKHGARGAQLRQRRRRHVRGRGRHRVRTQSPGHRGPCLPG